MWLIELLNYISVLLKSISYGHHDGIGYGRCIQRNNIAVRFSAGKHSWFSTPAPTHDDPRDNEQEVVGDPRPLRNVVSKCKKDQLGAFSSHHSSVGVAGVEFDTTCCLVATSSFWNTVVVFRLLVGIRSNYWTLCRYLIPIHSFK